MRLFFTIILTIFLSSVVWASAQIPDTMIYNGKKYMFENNPLESYFKKHPNKFPKSEIWSSGLSKGYIATFEIKDNLLYLKDIKIYVREEKEKSGYFAPELKSVLNKVFPRQELVKADWFTGLIVLSYGKVIGFEGFESIYDRYLLFEIDKGEIIQEKQFDNKEYEEFKEKQFQEFKKTEEYKKMKNDFMKKNPRDKVWYFDYLTNRNIIQYSSKILVEDDEK